MEKCLHIVYTYECCNIRGNALIASGIMKNPQKIEVNGFRVKEKNDNLWLGWMQNIRETLGFLHAQNWEGNQG